MSQLGLGMDFDDDTRRRQSRPRRSGLAAVVAAVLALALVGVLGVIAVRTLTGGGSDEFSGEGTGSVTVVVNKGDSLTVIGRTLADAGVVASADSFVSAASTDDRASGIAPGAYQLRSGMSGAAALELMLDPAARVVDKVAIPEGLRLSTILARVTKATGIPAGDLADSLSRAESLGLPSYAESSIEGFLFPATYEFKPDATADDVVSAMLARFDQAAVDVDLEAGAKALGLTPLQVVTIASLVQGESAPEDYDKVARVVLNRLSKGMKLQFDSTVNYALKTSELKLSAEQLATDSPYNTYKVKGLPPGPINSPGEAALQAVLSPATGTWLYFVSTDPSTKTTEFATTYDEFLKLKKRYQANVG